MGGPISGQGPRPASTPTPTNETEQTTDARGPGKSNLERSNAFYRNVRKPINTSAQREPDKALANEDIKTLSKPSLGERIVAFFNLIKNIIVSNLPFRGTAAPEAAATKITTMAGRAAATEKSASLTDAKKAMVTENLNMLMNNMHKQMEVSNNDIEGVFRKAAVNSQIAKALESMESEAMTADTLTGYSLHLKANVLKRTMEELASPADGTPLLDLKTIDDMANADPAANASRILKDAINNLDDNYRKDNINKIIDFLASLPREIPGFVERSLMDNSNLATVTAPKLLPAALEGSVLMSSMQKINQAFEKVLDTWTPSTAVSAE